MNEELPTPPLHTSKTGGLAGGVLVLVLFVSVTGLGVLTVVGREVHAAPAPLALAVLLLPYLYGVVGTLGVCFWVVAPDRRETPFILAAWAVAVFLNWAPPGFRSQGVVEGHEARLVSWNVRRLWGAPEDENDATQCVVDTLEAWNPDVIHLMEVSAHDLEALRAQVPMDCVHTTYREGAGPSRGGIASCVRGDRWSLQGGGGVRYVDGKDWHYVMTEVGREGVVFNALSVHLTPYKLALLDAGFGDLAPGGELHGQVAQVFRDQSDEAAALLERVGRFEDPTVLTGDFNSTRDTALHVGLRRHLVDSWARSGEGTGATTEALGWLPLRVDYVYVTPQKITPIATRSPEVQCSDHRPVVADLSISLGLQ